MSTDQITVTETIEVTLPAPTDWIDAVNDSGEDSRVPRWGNTIRPWRGVTAWTGGVECNGDYREDLAEVRAEALAMLAAVTATERYQAHMREVSSRIHSEVG